MYICFTTAITDIISVQNDDDIAVLMKNQIPVINISIADPEQVSSRVSGLEMNARYRVYLWPRTAAGRGRAKWVDVRTADIAVFGEQPGSLMKIISTVFTPKWPQQ